MIRHYVTNTLVTVPAGKIQFPVLRFEVPQALVKRLKQVLRSKQPLDRQEAGAFGEWLREIDRIHRSELGIPNAPSPS